MKFTLNAVDSNVISIIHYLYLYNIIYTIVFITLLVFALIAQNCVQIVTVILFYHLNVVILKDWLLKENFLFLIPRSCFIPALGSGSVFRAFGILESRPELRAAAPGCRLLQAKGRPRRTNTNCRTYKGLSCSLQLHYNNMNSSTTNNTDHKK